MSLSNSKIAFLARCIKFKHNFSQDCVLCGISHRNAHGLCSDCWLDLPRMAQSCPSCALPLSSHAVCGACSQHPPVCQQITAAFPYSYPIAGLIQQYKYAKQSWRAKTLAQCMWNSPHPTHLAQVNALVGIPMHKSALQERGFNQAHLLGQILAKKANIPVKTHLVQCTRPHTHQAGSNAIARQANIKGIFSTKTNWHKQHILLIDDVMTTGATLNELASTLYQAGAKQVDAWVLARTLFKQ